MKKGYAQVKMRKAGYAHILGSQPENGALCIVSDGHTVDAAIFNELSRQWHDRDTNLPLCRVTTLPWWKLNEDED